MLSYEKYRLQGLCINCGSTRQENRLKCSVCLEKDKIHSRNVRAKRKANNRCQRGSCNKSLEKSGDYFCKECRENHKIRRFNLLGIEITKEKYKQMLAEQGGVCAISGLPPDKRSGILQIDHNHSTNKVRQLLNKNINRAIGLFQENPEWLRKAADYLEKHANSGN